MAAVTVHLSLNDSYKNPRDFAGQVGGSTTVTMSGGWVKASVFGGGKLARVNNNTTVNISGGDVGLNKVRKSDGYVMYGSDAMGNVYGGGRGSLDYPLLGVVKGNTTVNVNGGHVYHMVYGGGALASVGTFDVSTKDGEGNIEPSYMPMEGIPYKWYYTDKTAIDPAVTDGEKTPTGTATVNITGGTIGISGRDNGLVFGGSRGDISDPYVYYTQSEADAYNSAHSLGSEDAGYKTTNDIKSSGFDTYLRLAWVNRSVVNIGTAGAKPTDADYLTAPLIKGSVYGGAENGHNYQNAVVNVNSGTIGITEKIPGTETTDPWWNFTGVSDELKEKYFSDRGNVYGAGSGADYFTDRKGNKHYNPKTGMVGGSTIVNIKGGHVVHNVYGAGSMASLGNIINARDTIEGGSAKHKFETTSFALSWPYEFKFAPNTGKATVNITGGHIGIGGERVVGKDNGNVYGGSRGIAGDRYEMSHLAIVNEAQVTIDFPYDDAVDPSTLMGSPNYAKNAIEGSVFGGGENGRVMGDTHVILKDGFVSHSMFGGGRGEGRYKGKLMKVGTTEYTEDEMDIFDWLSGKVYGNTYLTILDGRVLNNVIGGGYMASVGKGNYSGGADDFYDKGYGETITGNLWTSSFNPSVAISESNKPDNAWYFLNSGKTYVNVFGGEIGSTALWDGLPAGSVFGGCRGMAAPSLRESQRYLYNPEWLNGYANETHVTIGNGYECKAECTDKNDKVHAVGEKMSLDELQDLFAGKTGIVAANGTPNSTYWTAMTGAGPTIYGSVYGGAQDGRIRRDAHVTVNAGKIGLPFTDENRAALIPDYKSRSLQEELDSAQWLHRGNVYGAGSGLGKYKFDFDYDGDYDNKDKNNGNAPTTYYGVPTKEVDYCQYAGSVLRFTQVDILGGTIHRNVYGGGSLGSVGPPAVPPTRPDVADKKGDTTTHGGKTGWQSQCTVNIGGAGPVTIGSPTGYQEIYGGEVYGASRGMSSLNPTQFSNVCWTLVKILNGATIKGNVFGGGDAGMVKKNTEVKIGE